MHILINDFIGGALDRGIPLYVRNLIDGLREEGLRVSMVRAPAFCRRLPRSLFYAIAVMVEQFVVPAIGFWLRADLTIYPYNSVAILDLPTKRGRIVVHDLEQLSRPRSPAKAYYVACCRAVRRFNAPIFTISEVTQTRLIESGMFGNGPITLLPNTFYAFERLLGAATPARRAAILLCTGSTANKDLDTVIGGYLPLVLARGYRVSILGLHKATDAPRLNSLRRYIDSGQLRLCGRLADGEVAAAYCSHAVIWVHALREGFGRCVVEGRLAGNCVIASAIPEFVRLRDDEVHLYRDTADFMAILDRVFALPPPVEPYEAYPYRKLLHAAVAGLVTAGHSVAQSPPARSTPQGTAQKTPRQSPNP